MEDITQPIYWYAPFNNAFEENLSHLVAAELSHHLTIQTVSHRFGIPLPDASTDAVRFIRDLPPPAGELGEHRSTRRQVMVVRERARRRERLAASNTFSLAHLHTFNLFSDWAAIPRLRRNVPIVIQSVHDVRPHLKRLPKFIETSMLGHGYRSCDALIVADQFLADLLIQDFKVSREKVFIVPLPVRDLPLVQHLEKRRAGDYLSILFFGTFRENKGIQVLIDAIDRLSGSEQLRFHFAGRGETSLENLVKDLARRDSRVSCEIGFVDSDRVPILFNNADVIVLPYTRFDSQSGVLAQDAYGARRPVIASDIGALGRAVKVDKTGWLVRPGDAANLAHTITTVSRMTSDFDKIVSNIEKVAANRSLRDIAAQIVGVYRTTLQRDSAGHIRK